MPPQDVRQSCGLYKTRLPRVNMSMRSLKLNDEDRRVYETWRRNIILLWFFIVGAMAIVCTVLALDAAVPPEQRTLLIQQSGPYP